MKTLKIFVTGAFSSGKTAFIKSLSVIDVISTERFGRPSTQETIPPDREAITVAFDFGRLTLSDEIQMYFFGTPAARRVTSALAYINRAIPISELSFVVMVNSTIPEDDRESAAILQIIQDQKRPYVVALSKQDRAKPRTPQQVREALSISDEVKVLGYDWKDPKTTKQVMVELLGIMPQDDLVQQAIDVLKAQIDTP